MVYKVNLWFSSESKNSHKSPFNFIFSGIITELKSVTVGVSVVEAQLRESDRGGEGSGEQ